nr:hypothetical transcript [Hymenolepis microstoma]
MRLAAFLPIPTQGILFSFLHSHFFLLLLVINIGRVICASFCFNFNEEMKACAKKHNVPVPNDQQYGYAFGFGSLNETEEMCRTRGHITVFQCMQRVLEQKCRNTAEEIYLKTIWSFTIDTRRFEQAATYLCKVHNLQSEFSN